MKPRVLHAFVLLSVSPLLAQPVQRDTAFLNTALVQANEFYTRNMAEQIHLYNGVAYKGYSSQIDGLPFFGTDWDDGWVDYEGERYEIPLLYELVTDKLIVSHYTSHSEMELISQNVQGFSVLGHTFVRIRREDYPSLATGFYDVLYNGTMRLLAKRKKTINEKIVSNRLEPEFVETTQFFIEKEDGIKQVGKKRALLKALSDKKQEVKQHLREMKRSGIRFKNNRERAILSAVEFYDQSMDDE